MAKPRIAKSARTAALTADTGRISQQPSITVPGTVEKIIPAIGHVQAEKAQIVVEGADHLYREIRIDNTLHDGAGNAVSLKVGADVQVTIESKAEQSRADGAVAVSGPRSVRILIADDFPTILQMVKQILNAHPGFEVVGEARDGHHAVTLAGALKPDVIVINVSMPTMSGFEAARRIRSRLPDSAIVILSSHKDKQFIAEARKVGAKGYVGKSDADRELVRAVESAVKGEEFFVVE